jgi:hypothetical protein
VSVAGLVVVVPPRLENTASYSLPLSAVVVLARTSVSLVAATGEKVDPWSMETCHSTVGVGKQPLAAAVKVALWLAVTVWLIGCVVMTGGRAGLLSSLRTAGHIGATPLPIFTTHLAIGAQITALKADQ